MVVEWGGLGWVFDWTANLSLLDPGGSGDHATSHYSKRTPTHPPSLPNPPFFCPSARTGRLLRESLDETLLLLFVSLTNTHRKSKL